MVIEKNFQEHMVQYLTDKNAFILPPDLQLAYQMLSDESFIKPFLKYFSTKRGRPSIPLDIYIRIMFLKHYYNVGFEMIVELITTTTYLRYFCNLTMADKVPHPTTLIKFTKRVGDGVEQLNKELINKLMKDKKIKPKKIRIDTTAIQSNITYPYDNSPRDIKT